MLIDQYSTRGTVVGNTDTNLVDYLAKMPYYIDSVQKEIATTQKFIKKSINIIHSYPDNLITGGTFDIQNHTTEDISFYAIAKAYTFEVHGTAEVYIESLDEDDVVTQLEYLYIDSVDDFEINSGVIYNIPLDSVNIRIRFSGDRFYNYRNVAMFEYEFDDVPQYSRFTLHSMPSDFFKMAKITIEKQGILKMFTDFEITHTNELMINYYIDGTIKVDYYAYPTTIDSTTLDTAELEIDIEAQEAIPYKVAGLLLHLENPGAYGTLLQQYYAIITNLTKNTTIRPNIVKNIMWR
jgi:hypothetical protein